MTPAIPFTAHLFLLAVPAVIAAVALWTFVRGGRRGR